MFVITFYLYRNGDPERQFKFNHWPTPEEVATELRHNQMPQKNGIWDSILEAWAECVLKNGLPEQPELGKRNSQEWNNITIYASKI